MDVEKGRREELMDALGDDFVACEEVLLRHATFKSKKVHADVVAFPTASEFSGVAFAFEIKEPDKNWHFIKWSKVFHQASDYVFACVDDQNTPQYNGRRIFASFVYPSPPYAPHDEDPVMSDYLRSSNEKMMEGILHLALHFRVGHCQWMLKPSRKLGLHFGPNPVWEQGFGFTPNADDLLKRKRPLGSGKVDFIRELDGS